MTVQKADLTARRNAIAYLSLILITASILLLWLEINQSVVEVWMEWTMQRLMESPYLVPIMSGLMMLPLILFSIYLVREGSLICRAQRFPRPGQAVIRDTVIREGAVAHRYGRVLQVIALILLACAVLLPVFITRLFFLLMS